MRADRLLSLALLLRHRGRTTAAALAAELEVSVRTVLRDVEALSAAGIPVYAERGRAGGIALLPGFSTDLTGLTPDEAVALLTSPARTTSDALGMGAAFSSAIRKVVAAMPESSRRRAEGLAGRVLVRRGGWLRDPVPDAPLAPVHRAVFAGNRLRIRYASRRSADGPTRSRWRTVDPVGLVEAAGQWYLLALDGGADRTFRISRILEAEELAEPATRPDGVDLEALWQRRRADFLAALPGVEVTVRVDADCADGIAEAAVSVLDSEPAGPGRTQMRVWFGEQVQAEEAVWALAPRAEVIAPDRLRAALAERAAVVVAAHAPPD